MCLRDSCPNFANSSYIFRSVRGSQFFKDSSINGKHVQISKIYNSFEKYIIVGVFEKGDKKIPIAGN